MKESFRGKPCAWATPGPNGALFWENGIFHSENEQHYFFLIGGKLRAYLKSNVLRLEFNAAQVGGV